MECGGRAKRRHRFVIGIGTESNGLLAGSEPDQRKNSDESVQSKACISSSSGERSYKLMKLEGNNGYLELDRSELGPASTPADNDILLSVTVKVKGYSAADQAWVVASSFHQFLNELQKLDLTRKGRAVLEGASSDDLGLEFFSTDTAGHMAVKGHVGWDSSERHLQQLRFGFDFEPDMLPKLVREFENLRSSR